MNKKDRAINTNEKTREILCRGNICRGKLTKFSTIDEIFPRRIFPRKVIRNSITNENEDILADLQTVRTLQRDNQRQPHKANIIVYRCRMIMIFILYFHKIIASQYLGNNFYKLIPILEEDC